MSKNITIPVPAVPFAPPVYTCQPMYLAWDAGGSSDI